MRLRLSRASRSLRRNFFGELPPGRALSVKSDEILFDGRVRRRKRIVLLTTGCSIGTCTMCPFPGESHSQVRDQDLIEQFEGSFQGDSLDDYELITLFCNGNFFHDREMPTLVRQHIFARVRQARDPQIVAVESLPQFLTTEALRQVRRQLGPKKLAVFLGLQSQDEFVRQVAVNTTCTLVAFEKATRALQAQGDLPVTFLMVKPPFLTEGEAVLDCLKSLQYLTGRGLTHSTLCPTRVAPHTLLHEMHRRGLYSPPWIWSVVEVLRRNADRGGSLPMVNTTELKEDRNPDSTCAQSCPHCRHELIEGIEQFLFQRKLKLLQDLRCVCWKDYLQFVDEEQRRWGEIAPAERVRRFLRDRDGSV